MKTINLTWILPTTRVDGSPLPATGIAHSVLFMSADGGVNWSEMDMFAAPETAAVVPDLIDGDYHFRLVIVDTQGKSSGPIETSINVPNGGPALLAAPSPANGFTATIAA
jgi:hypothetical protein